MRASTVQKKSDDNSVYDVKNFDSIVSARNYANSDNQRMAGYYFIVNGWHCDDKGERVK